MSVKKTSAPELPAEPDRDDLRPLEIGVRLRRLRHARRLTLRDVAERADSSESFISQLERGRVSPSVASLRRVCDALGIAVHELFSPGSDGETRILRHASREVLHFGDRAHKWLLSPRPLHALEVVVCELEPGGSTGVEPYVHGDSEEICAVVSGTVELRVGDEVFDLEEGDSASYRSSLPHQLLNVGTDKARVLYVMTPPSY